MQRSGGALQDHSHSIRIDACSGRPDQEFGVRHWQARKQRLRCGVIERRLTSTSESVRLAAPVHAHARPSVPLDFITVVFNELHQGRLVRHHGTHVRFETSHLRKVFRAEADIGGVHAGLRV